MDARVLLSAVPLNLYRRHSRNAAKRLGGHAPDSRSYEPEELRRRWRKCACAIYADGTLAGKFKRRNTGETNWDAARDVAARWEEAGGWDANKEPAAPPPKSAEPPPSGLSAKPAITVEFATDAYLANRAARNIAESTFRKYRTFVKQLREFALSRGYLLVEQFDATDMDAFYNGWPHGVCAKAKKLERLKGFFRFCVKRKWIVENSAADLEPPVGAGAAANRLPFSDQELMRIDSACDQLQPINWTNHVGSGSWSGDDVKTMIMLLCWTGLRISDAVTFDMSRATSNPEGGANIFLRMHKTQGALSTWVDDWLYERLLARQRVFGPGIFVCGDSKRIETMTDLWRRRIKRVFDLAGEFQCGRPTPHVLRHTFVRLLLQRGVGIEEEALGLACELSLRLKLKCPCC